MKIKSNKHSPLRWVMMGLIPTLLIAGGYFGFQYYQNYQADKIYSVDETVTLPDFTVDITKAEFKPVDLPIDKDSVAKYGGLESQENCDAQSKAKTWDTIQGEWFDMGPSDYQVCNRRNNSRDTINEYIKKNSQLVVDYKITAINNVDTSKLKIELIPDSGRRLGEQVDAFNANQFFPDGAQYKDPALSSAFNAPGAVYTPEFTLEPYKPYHSSSIGNDINKGLKRTGYIYTDIRKSEESVDVKITYKDNARLVRITR